MENLPCEYSRIFRFENYRRARRRILSEDRNEGALVSDLSSHRFLLASSSQDQLEVVA